MIGDFSPHVSRLEENRAGGGAVRAPRGRSSSDSARFDGYGRSTASRVSCWSGIRSTRSSHEQDTLGRDGVIGERHADEPGAGSGKDAATTNPQR